MSMRLNPAKKAVKLINQEQENPKSNKDINYSLKRPLRSKKPITLHDEQYGQVLNGWAPTEEEFINRLCMRMREWADEQTRPMPLIAFWTQEQIKPSKAFDYLQKHPVLREALDYTKAKLGIIHYVGGIERKYDAGMVKWALPHYLKDLTTELNEEETLRKIRVADAGKSSVESNTIFVEVPTIPNSDLVPLRKKIKNEDKINKD